MMRVLWSIIIVHMIMRELVPSRVSDIVRTVGIVTIVIVTVPVVWLGVLWEV
jgi:hypothetical protein